MARSVGHNAIMNVSLVASNALATMITVPYVSRVLTVAGNGSVSFAQSTANWFQVFCTIGVASYAVRECARVRDDRNKLSILTLELLVVIGVCSAVSLSGFAAANCFIPAFRSNGVLMWIFLANVFLTAFGVEWFYQATEDYDYIVIRSIVIKVVAVALIVLFVKTPEDYILYGLLLALGTSANNIFNIVRLVRLIQLPQGFGIRDLHPIRHLKALSYFTIMNISTSMYLSFDTILLSMLAPGNYQTGLYQLAAKLKTLILTAITAIVNVITPRLSYLTKDGISGKYTSLLRLSFSFLLTFSLAIGAYMIVYAEPMVVFISSKRFLDAVPSVRIAGAIIFIVSVANILGPLILIPNNREKIFSIACLTAMPASLILNVLLDGRYGAIGASIALACTELVSLLVQIWACRKELRSIVTVKPLAKSIIPSAAASAASLAYLEFGPTPSAFMTLLVGTAIFGLVWAIGLLTVQEPTAMLVLRKFLPERGKHVNHRNNSGEERA